MTKKARSIAFSDFEKRQNTELNAYWSLAAALKYAERWWDQSPNPQDQLLSKYPGDECTPFIHVHKTPRDFISDLYYVLNAAREHTLVAIITGFETYLFASLERACVVKPSILEGMESTFTVSQLAGPARNGDFRRWIAAAIADRYIRKYTHEEMYTRLDSLFKAGMVKKSKEQMTAWSRRNLVRNAIVHASRTVTPELSDKWKDRYPLSGVPLALTDDDIQEVARLATELVVGLDQRFVDVILGDADGCDLIGQLYHANRINNPEDAVQEVQHILHMKISLDRAREIWDQCVAGQVRYP
jgi:hypothetical protein